MTCMHIAALRPYSPWLSFQVDDFPIGDSIREFARVPLQFSADLLKAANQKFHVLIGRTDEKSRVGAPGRVDYEVRECIVEGPNWVIDFVLEKEERVHRR